ncbi:ATP-binding protein [Alcaligenaceae bacterium]|nr:ATP-binding protein [Alcaligenaceae bacterium]
MITLATLSLSPGPQAIPQAQAWLEALAEQQQWAPRMAFKLGLCLDEALTNIVMYAFQNSAPNNEQAHIKVSVQADGTLLTLNIIDNGTPFDPTQNQPAPLAATLDDTKLGGHGLRLMRHYLQDIQYRRSNGQNQLRLIAAPEPGAA